MKERKGFFVWLILFSVLILLSVIRSMLDDDSSIIIIFDVLGSLLFFTVFIFAVINTSFERISFKSFSRQFISVVIFQVLLILAIRMQMMIFDSLILTTVVFVFGFWMFISLGVYHAWKKEPNNNI